MDLEEQILRYYLKVFSILTFISCFFILLLIIFIISKKNITDQQIIEIKKGENIYDIVNSNFKEQHHIERIIFIYYYKIISKLNKKSIHYGNFRINEINSFINILKIITKPSNILNKITIIEGWSKNDLRNELSKYFIDIKDIEYNEILADTYYFKKNTNFNYLYAHMKDYKKNYLNKFIRNNKPLNDFDQNEIMVIGSLLEKEGLDYNDKKKISSVIFNRLNLNMRLQIDATVIFSITNGQYNLNRNLLLSDLKFDHPFNTYIYKGLPPKPISYVGTNTIDIIFENHNTDYLFYFFNNSLNKHIFSKNYDEHIRKLNEYRSSK